MKQMHVYTVEITGEEMPALAEVIKDGLRVDNATVTRHQVFEHDALTENELLEMDGQPVYVAAINGELGGWRLVQVRDLGGYSAIKTYCAHAGVLFTADYEPFRYRYYR